MQWYLANNMLYHGAMELYTCAAKQLHNFVNHIWKWELMQNV